MQRGGDSHSRLSEETLQSGTELQLCTLRLTPLFHASSSRKPPASLALRSEAGELEMSIWRESCGGGQD